MKISLRIGAIVFIFFCTSVAWIILGATIFARTDSADIGFNLGLVGPTGTDLCGPDPNAAVTGVSETLPDPVPTVSEWGLTMMTLLVLTAGSSILVR